MEGADSKMSDTKRTALPSALRPAYSARYVPTMSPIGVPTAVPERGLDHAADDSVGQPALGARRARDVGQCVQRQPPQAEPEQCDQNRAQQRKRNECRQARERARNQVADFAPAPEPAGHRDIARGCRQGRAHCRRPGWTAPVPPDPPSLLERGPITDGGLRACADKGGVYAAPHKARLPQLFFPRSYFCPRPKQQPRNRQHDEADDKQDKPQRQQ